MEHIVKLFNYPKLNDLNVINCPVELGYSSMNVFLAEILMKNPRVIRFCKVEVNDAQKLEAVFLAKFQFGKAEEERKRLEEEQRLKEEAEAAQDG
jgi:hypothetical protein